MTRHRPRYPLWLGPGRPPIATCDCHLGMPLWLDRQMPDTPRTERRAAA